MIKPCTQPEISFYESAAQSHLRFAEYMPTFMGTLTQNADAISDAAGAEKPTAESLKPGDVGPMHGKALKTELLIVMQNIAAGFSKPNILDVKLGARLWDDDAPQAKRARLDDVAAKSTSGSLGFRIAGMKLWRHRGKDGGKAASGGNGELLIKDKEKGKGDSTLWEYNEESEYTSFNKLYGRKFSADDVDDGFKEYLGLTTEQRRDEDDQLRISEVVDYFVGELAGIRTMLEEEESRMYSASLLFVYEGDPDEYKKKRQRLIDSGDGAENEEEDDEDDTKPEPRLAAVKLIDFAHARWTPGDGPDENSLQGVRSTEKIFGQLKEHIDGHS